ncbi:MAG: permease, partial [candidate division KSB1 bacterium]|nr:permease [candidate division KSB1 bacterium]
MVTSLKNYFSTHRFELLIVFLFGAVVMAAHRLAFQPVIDMTKSHLVPFFIEMLSFLPPLFILIGLFDVWVPKETVVKYIGERSGVRGTVIVILFAMLQAGPLYVAFPIAHLLLKKGISLRNVFIYLGAFSTLKIPMLTFEMTFLGVRFSLLRTAITIPVFILIAVLMENYAKG